MLKSKAEQTKKATPHVDISLKRKANHPATSRSDIFSKLVKLVGLSDHRGSKTADRQEATGGPAELVAIGHPLEHSPVTLYLPSTTSLPTSGSKETLRSSSDSNLAVSALDDGFKPVQGTDLSSLIHTIDGSRSKHERKSTRRKAKTTPLSEPATFLTTIPEIASVFERTSLLPDLSFSGDSKYYPSEDALMDTDSIRARTAIALARAQLEHSRPASHNRKIERSSNQMMMLPNELEEYKAQTRLRSATIPSHEDRSVWNENLVDSDRDVHVMQKELEQSQAMVLTLMAAKEVKSQRATARKKSHSPPRVDLPKLPNNPSQGLYQAGDVPPCPPPSIPLPRLPPSIPLPPLPPKITVTGHKSEPTTPKLCQFGRSRASSTSSAYKGLPTVYRSDDETLKHIDLLMQSLLVEHPEQEDPSRKFCHSLPSRSGRGRSGSHSTTDGGRQSRRPRMTIPSEPMPVQRPAGHAPVMSPPQVPHIPTSRAYCELRFGSLPGPTKMAQFKPISFSYYDVLPSSTEDGMLNHPEHDTHSHRAACNLTFSGGPTGQYSQ